MISISSSMEISGVINYAGNAVNGLSQIMRRNICSHAHGNAENPFTNKFGKREGRTTGSISCVLGALVPEAELTRNCPGKTEENDP